jgi:hypothetical protein
VSDCGSEGTVELLPVEVAIKMLVVKSTATDEITELPDASLTGVV